MCTITPRQSWLHFSIAGPLPYYGKLVGLLNDNRPNSSISGAVFVVNNTHLFIHEFYYTRDGSGGEFYQKNHTCHIDMYYACMYGWYITL